MKMKKRNIAIGVGVVAGLGGLAYYLSTRKSYPLPSHTDDTDNPPGPDIDRDKDQPEPVEGRQVRVRVVNVYKPAFVYGPFRIDFMLVDDTKDLIVLDNPVVMTLTVTLPNGATVTTTGQADGINCGLGFVSYRTTQLGIHYANFEGFEYDFTTVANVQTSIFVPTGVELLWDCRPYVQESLDRYPGHQCGLSLRNMNRLLNGMHCDITSVNFNISKFLTEEPTRHELTVTGNIADPYGCIRWHVRLVPRYLYLQGGLRDQMFPQRSYTKIWTYPDPDPRNAIFSHRVHYYIWSRYDRRELGYPIRDELTAFSERITGTWGSNQRNPRGRGIHRWHPVEDVVIPGERYEVLVYVGCGLDPYKRGFDHASYSMRRYHVGYLIME